MGDDELRIPGEQRSRGGRARRAASSRDVPLGHAVLCLVVVALGVVMGVQSRPSDPGGLATPPPASSSASSAAWDRARVHPLAAMADAVLLRAAFSVVPEFQQVAVADLSRAAGPSASVSASMLGASGLRPAGLVLPTPGAGSMTGTSGVLWAAYERAVRLVSPRCHLQTSLLAAIGEVESGSLAGRRLDANHNVVPPVLGPVLSGGGVAAIRDTDDGRWDGNPAWDRAVGPMQFIPGTWRTWGSDGNGDGLADPQNVEDAAYSAARYLCAGGRDLSDAGDLRSAILSYNHSLSYLARVLELMGTIEPGSLPDIPTLATVAPRRPAPAVSSSSPSASSAEAPQTRPPTTTPLTATTTPTTTPTTTTTTPTTPTSTSTPTPTGTGTASPSSGASAATPAATSADTTPPTATSTP